MSRNKISKSKPKTQAKSKQKQNMGRIITSAAMEKDFKHFPKKIVAQIRNEIAALKKDDVLQQAQLKKAQLLKKAVNDKQDRIQSKTNGQLTATAKKQLTTLKKEQAQTNKTIAQLNKQIDTIKKSIQDLSNKNLKFAELGKQLSNFEKEIDAKIRKAPKKQPTQVKKSKKKAVKSTPAVDMPAIADNAIDTALTESITEPMES